MFHFEIRIESENRKMERQFDILYGNLRKINPGWQADGTPGGVGWNERYFPGAYSMSRFLESDSHEEAIAIGLSEVSAAERLTEAQYAKEPWRGSPAEWPGFDFLARAIAE